MAVVIGDVSEHGIPSALLMATARAFIRQRSALAGNIAQVVSDVNRQLTQDVEETGRFIMGVNKNWHYQDYEKGGLSGGQIIMLSTSLMPSLRN